ncbi:MAG: hypothetical protein ACRC28_12015 [Clostridium sp.]|uniref:hypothetical protein n=1 Tax=Clostridium sp. TaxID=1506 RepID=UPI003F3750B7
MGDPLVLRKLALDMIKRGNLPKAKLALSKSLSLDSRTHDTYTLLGDICFLENKYSLAKSYYLSAMHLLLSSLIKELPESDINSNFSSLPKEIQDSLPSKYACYVLKEYIIPYHMGQVLLNNESNEYNKVYKEALITKLTLNSILSRHGLSYEDYLEYRNYTLIPTGRDYLINNLQWNSIFSTNVRDLYL